MAKVSIIIPIYCVEQYIERCLQSVMEQAYSDIECIIVDDCTTDNSIQKCEQMIANYNGSIEFKVLHHNRNKGLSAARNTGTLAATGDYLYYLDSDDWINKDCIKDLINVAEYDSSVEMIMGGIYKVGDNTQWDFFLKKGIYTSNLIEYTCQNNIYAMAVNKLIRIDFIKKNKILFKEGLLHEDILWSMQMSCYLKKMASVENITYYYRIREGSIQTNNSKETHFKHLGEVKTSLINFVFENGFSSNKTLFDYITTDLPSFICCKKQLAVSFYNTFRECPYWTIAEQKKFGTRRRLLVLSLNRYLPKAIGLYYYRIMYKLLLTK